MQTKKWRHAHRFNNVSNNLLEIENENPNRVYVLNHMYASLDYENVLVAVFTSRQSNLYL